MFPLRNAARAIFHGPRFQFQGGPTSRPGPLWRSPFGQVSRFMRNNSVFVVRNCVAQVEFVVAFRIRRGVQVLSLYTRLWNEIPLIHYVHRLRRLFSKRAYDILFAAVAYKFNWDSNRITDSELTSHSEEFDLCSKLLKETDGSPSQKCAPHDSGWVRFIDKENISIWKKEVEKGLHTYKIYAKYTDVTATDFFELYLDIDNRTQWDEHAVILKKIDSEKTSNSDIIYWETKWPRFFSNRDYVFNRRWMVDPVKKVMVIKSKSTQHPNAPVVNGKSRVNDFWSYVVIKPLKDFSEPGLEFCLTYFDNHGAHLPSRLTLWVTVNGVPDYLNRLRTEALKLQEIRLAREAQEAEWAAERKRVEIVHLEELRRKESEKKDPPRPPEDEGSKEPDPVLLFIFTLMEKIKETLINKDIDIEQRVEITQKVLGSTFR